MNFGAAGTPRSMEDWNATIKEQVGGSKVFVYAKGDKGAAACGFSNRVMQIFDHLAVDYEVQNIFADANMKPALAAFSNWPTTPQVYVDGKFIGGCDIVTEMFQSGELQTLLGLEKPEA